MSLVVALVEWFRLLSPRAGLSNRIQSFTYRFHSSPAARLTDLQSSCYYFSCLYMCLCGTNIFCRYLLGLLAPLALLGSRFLPRKRSALRPSGSLGSTWQARLVLYHYTLEEELCRILNSHFKQSRPGTSAKRFSD